MMSVRAIIQSNSWHILNTSALAWRIKLTCGLAFLCLAIAINVGAQESDSISKFIQDTAQMNKDKSICLDRPDSPMVRRNLFKHVQTRAEQTAVTPQALAMAMLELYPCPFSPYRPDLRPATEKDIEGVWLFPESSQKLRFPSKLDRQGPAGPVPVKCDAVGYYPNGELRHAVIAGQPVCPFEKASDLEVARQNPIVSTWAMLRPGRISVTRTDVVGHIEEWDAYAVVTPFSVNDVQFSAGDLIAYVRKENGNEIGAATQFRHLKRLP